MKKTIKLTESDLFNIVKKVLSEQINNNKNINLKNLKFGDIGNDVRILQQKLIDLGFLKTKTMKPTGFFGNLTNLALAKVEGRPAPKKMDTSKYTKTFSQNNNPQKVNKPVNLKTATSSCQVITPKSDIKDLEQIVNSFKKSNPKVDPYLLINRTMNKYADSYKSQGIPLRTSCQLALIKIRPDYKDKNSFVVDSLNKLIYLYDTLGKFIAKDEIISGKDKQSLDPKVVAKSLLDWDKQVKGVGFKWVPNKGYVDTTGKNRKFSENIIFSETNKSKTRFLPKGIYTTGASLEDDKAFAGKTDNLLRLFDGNKQILQAIHGYYVEQPRTEVLKKAEQVLSKPNDPKVGQEFLNLVNKGGVDFSQSYGCINVSNRFLPYLRKYGPNSYVFNIGEESENYLVNNTENYFDKMMNSQSCPSPQSLGAMDINSVA
jgi:hypothetical protein